MLGSRAAEASNTFVLDGLFRSTNLVPVRRPHADDKVVANLARYPSDILSTDYLHDVDALRELSLHEILPAHRCRLQNKTTIPLFPKRCGIAPWTGPELVSALEVWVKYGHVVDPSETDEALNETAAMEDFQTEHDLWVQRECTRLAELLRARLRAGWAEVAPSNLTGVKLVADESMKSVLKFIRSLPRKAMARGVESGTFWQYPGKVATYIETAMKHQTTQCAEELFQVRRNSEARQRGMGKVGLPSVAAPVNSSAPLKLVKKSGGVTFEKASQARLSKIRARSKLLSGSDVKLEHQIGKAREECFVVFD